MLVGEPAEGSRNPVDRAVSVHEDDDPVRLGQLEDLLDLPREVVTIARGDDDQAGPGDEVGDGLPPVLIREGEPSGARDRDPLSGLLRGDHGSEQLLGDDGQPFFNAAVRWCRHPTKVHQQGQEHSPAAVEPDPGHQGVVGEGPEVEGEVVARRVGNRRDLVE